MSCCRMHWVVQGTLLMGLPGCDYGDKNRDPVAADSMTTTAHEVPVTINVLANDSDPDGGQATGTVSATVLPNAGVVIDGTLSIVPYDVPQGVMAAVGINAKGQIVGLLLTEDGSEIPAFIDADGGVTMIELPRGWQSIP